MLCVRQTNVFAFNKMSDLSFGLVTSVLMCCLCRHIIGLEYQNLAMSYKRSVSQSTTYDEGYSSVAENVVDGNTNQRGSGGSCSYTDVGNPAWWRIQFTGRVTIHRIVIYYMNDDSNKLHRFHDSSVYVSETGECGGTLVYKQTADPTDPWQDIFDIPIEADGTYVVICDGEQTSAQFMNLCEVQVVGCPYGQYGDQCNLTCGNCHLSTCNLANGSCPGDCENGYMGPMCNISCIGRCKDGTCNMDGCQVCADGKHGDDCDQPCPPKCEGSICSQNGGVCTGCKESKYWSENCSNLCTSNCNGEMCEQENGVCQGCTGRFWGSWCNKTCSSKCEDGICSQTNGYCSKGCILGYWGNQCEHDCQFNCKNSACTQNNGLCGDGCEPGNYGEVCDGQCGRCIDDLCDQDTGVCDGDCRPDYWGDHCNTTCPNNCFESLCTKDTGICGWGCSAGYRGYNCNEKCKTGTYGFDCSDKCGNCFGGNVSCFHINGKCIDGCIAPFIGHSCQSKAEVQTTDSSETIVIIGIGVAVGIAIAIIVTPITVFIYISLRKRCTKTTEQTNNENFQVSENVTVFFSNLDTRECDETYETIDMETENEISEIELKTNKKCVSSLK